MFTEPSPLTLVARTAISSLLMLPADESVAAETLAFMISFGESFGRLFRVCCTSNAIHCSRLVHGNSGSSNGAWVAARSRASLYLFVDIHRSIFEILRKDAERQDSSDPHPLQQDLV